MTSSPSHSSVGRLVSGSSAAISSNAHRRGSALRAGTLGLVAITRLSKRLLSIASSLAVSGSGGREPGLPPSHPILPLDLREEVVERLDAGEVVFLDLAGAEHFVEAEEAQQVIVHAAAGVIGTGLGGSTASDCSRRASLETARVAEKF